MPYNTLQLGSLLMKQQMVLIRELQHCGIDECACLPISSNSRTGAWRENSSKSNPTSSRNSAAAALLSRLLKSTCY
jgi:hypothetical protein